METKKVIWSLDVFEPEKNQKAVMSFVRALSKQSGAQVEACYVFDSPFNGIETTELPQWVKVMLEAAEERLSEFKKSSEIPALTTKIIFSKKGSSVRNRVDALVGHSEMTGADMIVVATHARQGLPRLFMGSFAESLVLQTSVPVLTINPESRPVQKIAKVLYPNYFSADRHEQFEDALSFAKSMGAELTLYHKEALLFDPVSNPYAMAYLPSNELDQRLEEEREQRLDVSLKWHSEGLKAGVSNVVKIDDVPGHPTSAITEFARDGKFDLILMVTETKPSLIIGSVTRQVAREADCPVLILKKSAPTLKQIKKL